MRGAYEDRGLKSGGMVPIKPEGFSRDRKRIVAAIGFWGFAGVKGLDQEIEMEEDNNGVVSKYAFDSQWQRSC